MKALLSLAELVALVLCMACEDPKTAVRLAELEKQNKDLKEAADKRTATAEYDLQAKCARDAKVWFNENWGNSDKDTILLDHTNHYNKSLNKCFILVEYHYTLSRDGSWINSMSLTDVYENSQFGSMSESHVISSDVKSDTPDVVQTLRCSFNGNNCKTSQEFYGIVRPYMSN